MVRQKNFGSASGGLGTGKMVCLMKLCGAVRWPRHRKDGVPKELAQ